MKLGFMQGRLSPIYKNKIQSFPWNNWKEEIKKAQKHKFTLMEWTLDYPNLRKNPLLKNTSQTLKFIKHNKIHVESITCDFFMQKPFFKKNYNINDIIFVLEKLKNTHIKKLVIPLVDNSSIKKIRNKKKIVNQFLKINKISNNRFKFLFESDLKPKSLKKFIELFPSKNFGINYDIGNSACNGYNIKEEFKLYGEKIYNIHLKDRKYRDETIRFGQGNSNFKELFKILKKNKYKKNLILQSARHKSRHLEELILNRKYIERYL